jgi:hypothetical protein
MTGYTAPVDLQVWRGEINEWKQQECRLVICGMKTDRRWLPMGWPDGRVVAALFREFKYLPLEGFSIDTAL